MRTTAKQLRISCTANERYWRMEGMAQVLSVPAKTSNNVVVICFYHSFNTIEFRISEFVKVFYQCHMICVRNSN